MNKEKITLNQNNITNYMYLGLLPFFACALGPWVFADYEIRLTQQFLFYSSIIFVFLAGIIWGIALFSHIDYSTRHIHLAIVFSLWPLISFFLTPILATGFMLLGFLLLLFWEKCFINDLYPSWYQKLRHQITFIVVACHMLVIFNLLKS